MPDARPTGRHFLSDLRMDAEVISESSARVRIPATPHVLGPDGGVRIGVLATLVDVVGGTAALRTLNPDWMATADLTIQMARPAIGPFVEARAAIVRKGRTTLVIEALVVDVESDGSEVAGDAGHWSTAGWAAMTFAILPGRGTNPMRDVSDALPMRWSMSGDGLDRSVVEALGITVDDAATGRAWLPVHDYLRNSFGAVQGGVMALLAEVAATEMLGAAPGSNREPGARAAGEPVVATDLQVAYLNLGRVGPIVSRTRVLDSGGGITGGSAVVELIDRGAGEGPATVVNVSVAPVESIHPTEVAGR